MEIVKMVGIEKRFGPVFANKGIDLVIRRGEIHALLGENGAGKSTLMKILFGLYRKDRGSIYLKGERVDLLGPRQAIAQGVGMVHQHFMLVDSMTVLENCIAGEEPGGFFFNRREALETITHISKSYGLKVDPRAKIQDISVGEQQRVEILKALYRNAEILILDEPTAVLTPGEVDDLFSVMENLKTQGKSILFITHKLKETMKIAQNITVLREGRRICTVKREETSIHELAEMMVGRKIVKSKERRAQDITEPLLKTKGLTYERKGRKILKDIQLQLRAGEILGIAGVEGNGQLELEEVLTGLRRPVEGTIYFSGEDISTLGPRAIREMGMGYIPSDRLRRGLVPHLQVAQNLILGDHYKPPFSTFGHIHHQKIREYAEELMVDYQIKAPSYETCVEHLSGGNQQRVIIAREFSRDPRVIVAAHPTRGVDIGAIEYIHQKLFTMREEKRGILLISADMDELRLLSDTIAVIYEGEMVAIDQAHALSERELGLLMAGERRCG